MHFKALLLLCGLLSFTAASPPQNGCNPPYKKAVCCNSGGQQCHQISSIQACTEGSSNDRAFCCKKIRTLANGYVDTSDCIRTT
ncbi:hypothetical protein BKA57DRAFT_475535 [Linnemannia elongata]|nr:hypothetical protein BKA57DRAFT_475535 [Linnemannia elongata]